MSRVMKELSAMNAFMLRDFDLSKRYIGWEIVFLVYTTVNSITIGLIGVGTQNPGLTLYLLVGALMWSFLAVLFHVIADTVAWEVWEGTVEYTFMAPVHRLTHLFGVCLYAIVYGAIRVVIVMLLLSLFFKLDLGKADFVAAMIVLCAASVSFVGLGMMAAVLPLLSPEKGPQATHIILACLLLVSGVYYPVSALPAWLAPLAKASPATYALNSMRAALIDGKGIGTMGHTLVALAIGGAVLIPAGYFIFSLAESYAKRTGRLKRQG